MVSDKGGWCYWRCGGRAPLNYLLERDMLRHRFPFLAGEDTPQTTLSHPLVTEGFAVTFAFRLHRGLRTSGSYGHVMSSSIRWLATKAAGATGGAEAGLL